MQKKSRFLTGLLSAVMALTLFALPATAANDSKVPTMPDLNKKGSITINKYDYKISSSDPRDNGESPATGNKAQNPLDGAEFTIYQVEDSSWITNYYASNTTLKDVTVDNYLKDGAIDNSKIKNNNVVTKTTGPSTENPDTKHGQAIFNGLPVGLYVVIETNTPPAVTSPTDPFLVSIPMTSATDQTQWLYDVIVNPKNNTQYGSVKLQKKGQTGDSVITEMAGYTFKLEKYINGQWVAITNYPGNGKDNGGATIGDALKTDASGEISIDGLTDGKYRFTEESGPDNGYIIDKKTHYAFRIDGGAVKQITGETEADTNYNAVPASGGTIVIFNYKPDLDKNMTKKGTTDVSTAHDADYSVGEQVPYKITVKVPQNIKDLKSFNVTDTPTNLAFIESSLAITCDSAPLTKDTNYVVELTHPDINNNEVVGFKIDFKSDKEGFVGLDNLGGKTITIEYKATLLKAASTGIDGNLNTAKLVYSNEIKPDSSEGATPTEREIHDSSIVYTFEINIIKRKDSATGDPIDNVAFDLYQEFDVSAVPAGKTALNKDEADALKLPYSENKAWVKIGSATTQNGGKISFKGLSNGNYKLVETKTIENYNLLSGPVDVTLNVSYVAKWDENHTYDKSGKLVKHTYRQNEVKFEGNNTAEDNTTYVTTTIVNRKGLNLPVTGGFGTLLFSGIGALLVVGGIGVLMGTKKKKDNA